MRTRAGLLALTVAIGALALTALPVGAASVKLKFFQQAESTTLFDTAGHVITDPNHVPVAGEKLDLTDRDFVGNHKKHAKHYTATDHLRCTFTAATTALCSGSVAIGGSMLLADDVNVDFSKQPLVINGTGGTGIYKKLKGSLTIKPIPHTQNADIVITLHH